MKTMMMAGLALCALSTSALAEPQKMNEDQMGDVTAGIATDGFVPSFALWVSTVETSSQTNTAAQVGEAAAVNLLGLGSAAAGVTQTITQINGD
jgi:hypothetical protein